MFRSLHMKLVLIMLLLITSLMAIVGAFLMTSITSFYIDEFYQQMESVFGDSSPSSGAFVSSLRGRGYLGECVEGLMNMANMPNIIDHLLQRGYKECDIKKILGENWLRVFRETWKS